MFFYQHIRADAFYYYLLLIAANYIRYQAVSQLEI